jgi:hypothetical protein
VGNRKTFGEVCAACWVGDGVSWSQETSIYLKILCHYYYYYDFFKKGQPMCDCQDT